MGKKVSIILLNYNGKKFNHDCIDSLLKQSYHNFEVIFTDNNSTDGSLQEVEKEYSKKISEGKIKIVANQENYGFAQGNNIGVQNSDPLSEYICILNNDTLLPEDWLQCLVEGIESNTTLGVVGGMIYDRGYEDIIQNFTFVQHKKGVNNYFFDSVIVDQTAEDKNGDIIYTTGVSGCCLLYKKALLDKPFDDIYFAYMEDTALCMKILLQGYRVGLAKKAIVHHLGSGSFGKKPTLFKIFHGQKNYILNFVLFSQGYRRIIVLPFFVLGVLVRTCANYPLMRIQGLGKALYWIITHHKTIHKLKGSIKKTVSAKIFYRNLSTQFLSLPFYSKTNRIHAVIIGMLNTLSKGYFRLFSLFFIGLGK